MFYGLEEALKADRIMLTKEDAYLLDNSMFVVEGSWETGYVLKGITDILYALGIKDKCFVGEWSTTWYAVFEELKK